MFLILGSINRSSVTHHSSGMKSKTDAYLCIQYKITRNNLVQEDTDSVGVPEY